MKIYLAARYDRLVEMRGYAEVLRNCGYSVDCRWLNGNHQLHPSVDEVEAAKGHIPMEARPFAEDDVEDLFKCDALIFFSERPESHSKRGGRHVEFGIALAMGKRIMVIGPRENVFHCLSQVEQYDSFTDCLEAI